MPNNVYWLDRNCITQGCNNNILKLLNLKKLEDFVGINYSQMAELAGWTEGQAQSFENDDREVMETGIGKFNVEEPPLYNKEGEPIYYVSSRVPIFDNKGKEVIGVVGISVDITERKKYEIAKLDLLMQMAHDLKSSLDLLNIQIQEKTPLNQKALSQLIQVSSRKLTELVNTITN